MCGAMTLVLCRVAMAIVVSPHSPYFRSSFRGDRKVRALVVIESEHGSFVFSVLLFLVLPIG